MKKNILEEMSVHFIREELIHNNALLVYRQNEKEKDLIDVCVRYVDHNAIREQFLTTIPKMKMLSGLIEINSTGTAIATYQEVGEEHQLDRIYILEEHAFVIPDFMELEYKKWFPENQLSERLMKKRGTKDGKH